MSSESIELFLLKTFFNGHYFFGYIINLYNSVVNNKNIISYKYLIMSRNHRGKIAVAIAGCDGNGKAYKFGGIYDFSKTGPRIACKYQAIRLYKLLYY